MIEKGTLLYEAVEDTIMEIFDAEIPLTDPFETTKLFVKSVNNKMFEQEGYEDNIEVNWDHINTQNILKRIIK